MDGSAGVAITLLMMAGGIVCGVFAGHVAGHKGFSSRAFFFGGLFLGPLALLAAAGLPDKKLRALLEKNKTEG